MLRGPFVQDVTGHDYYPYPFMNVQLHGYVVVLFNTAVVTVLFLAVSAGAASLDERLPGSALVTAR